MDFCLYIDCSEKLQVWTNINVNCKLSNSQNPYNLWVTYSSRVKVAKLGVNATVSLTAVIGLIMQTAVYKICKEMYCEGTEDVPFSDDDPDLIGDR